MFTSNNSLGLTLRFIPAGAKVWLTSIIVLMFLVSPGMAQNNPELEFVCLPCNSSIIPFCNLNDNHFDILVNKGDNFKDDDVIDLAITGNQKLLFDQLNKAIYNSMPNLDPIDDTHPLYTIFVSEVSQVK